MSKKKVLALITARGGSKGLPGKNSRNFLGHPLVAWSVAHALGSTEVDTVLLSTDDAEIAGMGKKYGAEVPFMRPPELSGDSAGSVDVAIHALDFMKAQGKDYDILLLLQPTSPIRKSSDLDGMVRLLEKNWEKADGVVTTAVMKPSPFHSLVEDSGYIKINTIFSELPRQELPTFMASYGVGWAIKASALREQKTFHPKLLLPWPIQRVQAVDIDEPADFVCAEALQILAESGDPAFRPEFRVSGKNHLERNL